MTFWKSRRSPSAVEQVDPTKAVLEALRVRYVTFCANPFRDEDTVANELDMLLSTPGVNSAAFYSDDVLMVGTDVIHAQDYEGTMLWHEIGAFIIYIVRVRNGRSWWTDFRFQNVTRMVEGNMHPHITMETSEYPFVDGRIGRLCISQGQFPISTHMRKGEMHLAVPRMLRILQTYQEYPFHGIKHWPVSKGGAHD